MSTTTTTKTTKIVNIDKKLNFKDDSFFKDSWSEFDDAMKDAIERWDKKTSEKTTTTKKSSITPSTPASETKKIYRQIRSENVMADESQAISCTEENDKFRMVMDVKDFAPDKLSIKAVDDNVLVEGCFEKKEGNTVSTQKFVRKFLLPEGRVNMSGITSALSRDGVLTIYAPKQTPPLRGETTTIPINRPGETTITGKIMDSPPRRHAVSYYPDAAGKATGKDTGSFNPTGGSNTTYYTFPASGTGRISVDVVPNARPMNTSTTNRPNEWKSFDNMVDRSQREMEDMMSKTTLDHNYDFSKPSNTTAVAMAPSGSGAVTTRDVTRRGNEVTERQEQRWDDMPAPGEPHYNNETTIPIEQPEETQGKGKTKDCPPRRHVVAYYADAAGKPTSRDNTPFNPTGGSNTTYYTFPASPTGRISVDVVPNKKRSQ